MIIYKKGVIIASLIDNNNTMQIIGCLIKNPMLLADPKVNIDEQLDFTEKMHKLVYGAIYNLFNSGITKITPIDIDNYLSTYSVNYEYYKESNGLQYLNDAEDFAQPENFEYYFLRFKKLSLLRYFKNQGYNISEIYNEKPLPPKKEIEMEEKFNEMTLNDIFNFFKSKIDNIEKTYRNKHTDRSTIANEGIEQLIENFKVSPEVGIPLYNDIMNTIVRGQRLGKLYLSSASSGSGKTRSMVGEMCHIVYPFRYNKNAKRWIQNGFSKKALIIITEMEAEEIQTMIPAYLADVNEDHILQGTYEDDEEERVKCAIEIMKAFPFFYIEQIPDPNVAQIQSLIRYYVQNYNIEYVFYDYIFSSPGLLGEYRDLKVREDVALLMLSNGLKEIATECNIYVRTATQLNAAALESDDKPKMRNQNMLRGSKAVADKIDVGYITMPITMQESMKLEPVCQKLCLPLPTHVSDIYKNRRGRYTSIRVWHEFDLGTCRMKDLFVTDHSFNPINIQIVKYLFGEETVYDTETLLKSINERRI